MLTKLLVFVGLQEPPKPKRTKRTHDLFCDCRNCNPSVNTYIKKMKEYIES